MNFGLASFLLVSVGTACGMGYLWWQTKVDLLNTRKKLQSLLNQECQKSSESQLMYEVSRTEEERYRVSNLELLTENEAKNIELSQLMGETSLLRESCILHRTKVESLCGYIDELERAVVPAPEEEGAQGLLLASDPLRIHVSEVRRRRALVLACRMGDLERVKESMRKAEDLLIQDLSGEIPLAAAYWSLCTEVIEFCESELSHYNKPKIEDLLRQNKLNYGSSVWVVVHFRDEHVVTWSELYAWYQEVEKRPFVTKIYEKVTRKTFMSDKLAAMSESSRAPDLNAEESDIYRRIVLFAKERMGYAKSLIDLKLDKPEPKSSFD